ncbi:MAG TPA: C25 family cysteine peptidase [Kofleriaceae bacterium]
MASTLLPPHGVRAAFAPTVEAITEAAEEPTELFPSGVREDGALLATKISIKDAAAALRKRVHRELHPAVGAASARAGLESAGLPYGVTPENLARAGWAAVFSEDALDLRDRLQPLLDRRKQQAGDRYKELVYKPGESVRDFLSRHNVTLSDITPSRLPYHLMLVGSPKSLSFELQYLLDLTYSVGRLWFDDNASFASYANGVVAYETAATVPTRNVAAYWSPTNGTDRATKLSSEHLVTPLVDGTAEDGPIAKLCGFEAASSIGASAKKAALTELLHDGDKRPALLFTASHGLACASGSPTQRQRQGALITADWNGSGALDAQKLFCATDITDAATIHGLVAFVFACYGAGTPAVDQFAGDLEAAKDPTPIAPEPFIAALAQRLLGHPGGGALAVIGHVERAWGYSIRPPRVDPQIQPFRNAIARILAGEPLGEATIDLSTRHATLSTELLGILSPSAAQEVDETALVSRWIEQTDARNYVLLGDPAVRVRRSGR